MSNPISRRKVITGGVAAVAGVAAAAHLADRNGLVPPTTGKLYAPGETLTYASQRLLTNHSLAREFSHSQISAKPFPNGDPPKDEAYRQLQSEGFKDWQVAVGGMVARPVTLSMADLKSYPSSNQITHLACEEGWSFIAEWKGVRLSHILDLAGAQPQARFVVYYSIQKDWMDAVDMADALHPQTLLCYGMNGDVLPPGHGGPLRMRVPRQLGYKNVKYITRLMVTDTLRGHIQGGDYSWYAGI